MLDLAHVTRSRQPALGAGALLFAILLGLAGCGAEDGGAGSQSPTPSPAPTGTVLEGRVADGYLANATVFLDRNGNKLVDAGEPRTMSGSGGRYSLEVPKGDAERYPVVVQVSSGRTIDEDSGVTVPHDYTLETPLGRHAFISPLTTLVQQELAKNASYQPADAAVKVRSRFGLDDRISLWEDYLAPPSTASSAAWERAHQTAAVLAGLEGRLLDLFRSNLGGSIPAEDYPAATAVVGDLMLRFGDEIALSLSDTVVVQDRSSESLIDWLLGKIEAGTLNSTLLERYSYLLADRPAVWDATPPAITGRTPANGTEAPVITAVRATFDEALDPASVGNAPLVLRDEYGIVPGVAHYDPDLLQLSFVPDNPLFALTDYTVELSPQLADSQGNQLDAGRFWSFSTLFDLSPPALPAF